MLQELRLILALFFLVFCSTINCQDTVNVLITKVIPEMGESTTDFTARLQRTCANNTFPPGVVIRFNNTPCPGPFILSPILDRSLIAPDTVASDEILLGSAPFLFNADETRQWYVHCGSGYKTNSICIDIDSSLLPDSSQAIPTLSTWGLILLFLLLSILFPLNIRKRDVHLSQ